ncbi:hypothetical protein DICVIV_01509 [Dictyocaulus viviparus]|uniref:Uncharacterized protein n=1 Tax=Dictyocaulus viviparus TaxID=29172 RepID=A0A0D8Y7Z3_DICVI|nr:hypothetical protein DICVIV_01509 [Dictyocaulus viviparus]
MRRSWRAMSGPYGQPGYNPQYQNPYPASGPPPPGWSNQGGAQQEFVPPPMPHPNMMGMGANPHYMEGGESDKYNLHFSDRTIRAAFVRKVFFMVSIMWCFLFVYLTLMCCESVRRSFPANIIMTAIFTLAVGYMTMMITVHHNVVSVLLTLIICTICCGSIIIFSSQTKYDLTNMMGIMFILSMCLMVFGLVAMISAIFFKVPFLYMVYAALASLLFMFYLAIDVQATMLMGGRKYEISPEDHIFASVQIFLDIVYIFWMLLSLLGFSKLHVNNNVIHKSHSNYLLRTSFRSRPA